MEPKKGEFKGDSTNRGKEIITETIFGLAVKPHAHRVVGSL